MPMLTLSSRRAQAALLLSALVALAATTSALARPDASSSSAQSSRTVTPKRGPWYGLTKPPGGKDASAEFAIKGNKLVVNSPNWPAVIAPTTFKCNEALIQLAATHVTISHGRFSYHGPATDAAGGRATGITGTLTWTGTFTSPTSVKGTMRFQTSVTPVFNRTSYTYTLEPTPCDTGSVPWSGKAGKSLQ
jgi:hypothetical protein